MVGFVGSCVIKPKYFVYSKTTIFERTFDTVFFISYLQNFQTQIFLEPRIWTLEGVRKGTQFRLTSAHFPWIFYNRMHFKKLTVTKNIKTSLQRHFIQWLVRECDTIDKMLMSQSGIFFNFSSIVFRINIPSIKGETNSQKK